MERERWVFALKAGKLGFSELACAYDAWRARFAPHGRVHLFSRGQAEASDLLSRIRFGLLRLPPGLRWPLLSDAPGGDTFRSLKLRNPSDPDDSRTIVSYPAAPHASIDQSAVHVHVDELAHMRHAREVWGALASTVAPGGSCHIVTRGSGQHHYAAELWKLATTGDSPLVPHFSAYDARPGRDPLWRASQAATMHHAALLHFAPETPEDSLAGDEEHEYIRQEVWDGCFDQDLPSIAGDSDTRLVLGLDLGLRHDYSAVVAVSRHPARPDDAAIRAVRLFRPKDSGGVVDLDAVEEFLRQSIAAHNVVQLAYDEWQAASLAQRLQRDGLVWPEPFGQGTDRAVADSALAQLALQRRVWHNGDPDLRQAILNARAHLTGVDDRQLRMVKRAPDRHIDAAVAASMAVSRCLALNL
jgi:hypothetical protein